MEGKIKHQATTQSTPSLAFQIIAPLAGIIIFILHHFFHSPFLIFFAIAGLLAAVLSAVHHAEIIAAKVGEPFGALVLALAVTVIEVSIILSIMLTGKSEVSQLARDTVFAAVMIIMTGMTGITLFIGGIKFHEQAFPATGVISLLTLLVAISTITLILPNFTVAQPGPYYSNAQLIFVAIITLVLYGSFLFAQNFRHRNLFAGESMEERPHPKPNRKETFLSALMLPLNLVAVVLLAESLAPDLEALIEKVGAPISLAGIVIACVILLPEAISAIKAASKNQMQRSLNLSLGSALASISLTIPVVSIFSVYAQIPLALGIDYELMVLFILSIFVLILSLAMGRTTILQGIILLVLFAVYLFVTVVP